MTSEQTRILVTGATGHLGGAALDHLLTRLDAHAVVGLARTEEKAALLKAKGIEVRIGDYADPAALDAAMARVGRVLLVSSAEHGRLVELHTNVIAAAERAGVAHLVYTGTAVRDADASPLHAMLGAHFQTERRLAAGTVPFTVVRNSRYADALPFFTGPAVLEQGIALPGGTGRVPWALRREMAEAAANVLLQDGHEGRTYHLTGPQALTFAEIAAALSDATGTPVAYTDLDPETHTAQLRGAGVPEQGAAGLAGFLTDMREGRYDIDSTDLATLLDRTPTPLREALSEIYPHAV
ncbi:SDR family oxidoreductase [Glycomyces sp. NPDC047010]|uniref:SDR family oxidoreductase n=1 Tax=Glycomyces sp. NPDC047010 TaxID=3155023 RepID=UPI0033F89CB6